MTKPFRITSFFFALTLHAAVCFAAIDTEIPYQDAVNQIMAPLNYSGIDNILGKDALVSLDIDKRVWNLHNSYRFDNDGNILLNSNHSGLCGTLSRYMYGKIKDVFPQDRYKIMFEKVKEKDFFFTPQATHMILTVTDLETGKKYLLDPSFKRYGAIEDFDNYIFVEQDEPETFLASNQSPDKFFDVDSATPIMIRNDYLLVFSVESVDGKIDKNHFILAISAVKRQATSGDYVMGLKYIDGYLQTYSDEGLMRRLLKPEEVTRFQQRMLQWSIHLSEN